MNDFDMQSYQEMDDINFALNQQVRKTSLNQISL
jgi:hypothetical protein